MRSGALVSVVGARPQFIKLAALSRAISHLMPDVQHMILHTGQHYDYGMSDIFFKDLNIPHPDINLNVGSALQGAQTGAMIASIEEQLLAISPCGVIAFGDTNSTLAAALAASKLHIPLFHVEAGLRSFDRNMPEEINRIVADHCSDRLYAPTDEAMSNLSREGLSERALHVGDVMYDAILYNSEVIHNSAVISKLGLQNCDFGVVTIHRASNTRMHVLHNLMQTISEVANELIPLVFPMHPRTKATLGRKYSSVARLHLIEPQSYPDMLSLVRQARLVLTDSGGLQKEAACLGTPCVTLRESTEWVETIEIGANTLTGTARDKILDAVKRLLTAEATDWGRAIASIYGKGNASEKIARDLVEW